MVMNPNQDAAATPPRPPRLLVIALSNTLEGAAKQIVNSDPANRELLVVNNMKQSKLAADEFELVPLLDWAEYERRGDPDIAAQLHPDRRSFYRRTDKGTIGSTPFTAHAAVLMRYQRLRERIQMKLVKLARNAGPQPEIYVLMLLMDTAGWGGGSERNVSAATYDAGRQVNVRLRVTTMVVESTIPDAEHPNRIDRQHAYKLLLSALFETDAIVHIGDVQIGGYMNEELYFLDQPAGEVEATQDEMTEYVREAVETSMRPQLRAYIDGQQQQWAEQASVECGPGRPVAGVLGHVVVRFDREGLAQAGSAYQLQGALETMARRSQGT